MARVQLYERAVVIHTLDIEIQDGAKIKEEPADTTSNTDATKDSMLVRNCFSLIDHDYHCDESSLPKKDTLYKDINNTDINNTENGHSSNDDSVHSNDVNKTVNIAHTSAKPKEEIHNTLLQFNKQECSNEVSNNKNTNVLRTTTKNVKGKRKSKRRRETPSECNVCFRTFSSGRNYAYHLRYFSYSDNNICRFCNRHYVTKGLLQTHVCLPDVCKNTYKNKCHFCTRTFRKKVLLQSHLFHIHGELIDCNNEIKHKTSRSKNVNTPPEDATLRTGANGESYSNNLREDNFKSEKINTTLTNNVNKSPNDEISPTTKRLRQPTLTEYLELCKKKRDIKLSPNKLNFVKNDSPKSDNLPKQTAPSTLERTTVKHETPKKPFVRLHADFEMMKSFLENLSDTVVKDKRPNLLTKSRRSNTISYDREVPYRLRSLGGHFSMEIDQNIGIRRRNRTRVNIELKRKQNAIDEADKVDPEVDLKIVRARFKCKECTIPLTRCDEQPRNSYQISTIDTMKNTSLTTQCNSTLVEESDAGNNMALKDLEVSVERLISVPNIKVKTELDVETHNNNCFLCKVCKETFSSRLDRHVHIKSSHIAYMSSICDARYTQKHKLLQHYLSEHLFKQNQCCICYMLLPDYEALMQHLNVHCLKYIQREDDKYPIDIELKCDLIKKSLKCLHCNQKFSSQSSLEAHQSCCIVQEEMEKDQQESIEEASAHPKDIPEIQHGKNTDEIILTCDEIFNPDDSSKTLNSDCVEEKSNEHQTSLHSEKEPEVNEANQNVLVNNNLSEEKIENVNKSQDSKKLSENNNSAISNQNTANTQLDDTTRTMTYPCDICGKQFHNPKNLEIHTRSFSFSTDICPMCGTGFSSKRLLQTHISAAHVQQISQTYSFHCVFCNQGFLKKHDLRPHILHLHSQQVLNTLACNYNVSQEKSDKSSVIHTKMCNVCNLVFETNDRYVEHRMYYYKNHTFTCSLCAQNFQGLYMFNHHTKLIHYSEEKRKAYSYICEICNEGFNHENHFYSHNMHVHSNEVNLVETAKEERNSNVQEKIGNSSTDQQKQNKQLSNEYTCEICQLKCIDMNDMVKHRELYSNDGDFRCDKCKRRCRTIHLLDQHRKSTHLYRDIYNRHACHVCDEVLETVTALNCHEKHFHSNITDNNKDNWKNCDQMSSSNITSKITEHPRKSKNDTCTETKYNCVFCNMKFPTANTVQTHIVHVHMDDMIAKRAILKLTLPIVNNDDIQKQLLEADPATSVASISSASTSSASTSEDNSTQLLQRPMIQRPVYKLLGNTTAKNTIKKYDRATIELLKKAARSKNNKITEKTSIPAIPCINKSKDISTVSTIAPNTESKTNTSVSLSTGLTTFRTVAPSKFGNNTSVLLSTGPTISKAIVTNTESKDNTLVPPSGSTNDLQKSSDVSLKSGSMNKLEAKSILLANRCITNKSIPEPLLTEPSPIFRRVMPEKCKSNEITNQKSESVNGYSHGYSCPLCPLEYPSLMFFHAHLKYAHADAIRIIEKRRNRERKVGVIECLLCPCNFTIETKYKKHLRNSHTYYVYIPHSQERTKINNERNPLAIKTNINRKSTIPETITVDDVPETITVNDVPETITVNDDDANIKNTSDQQATEVTATPDHGRQNEKIGKLRVRSFAKIIENLSADSTLKL